MVRPGCAIIVRDETSSQGTFGRLFSASFACFTGELPWLDNLPNKSCIPAGLYEVVWTFSPKFKRYMYLVLNVPRRTGIRKHSANFMGSRADGLRSQLYGCIALGLRLGYMDGQKALLQSTPAMLRFAEAMQRQPFKLEIIDAFRAA